MCKKKKNVHYITPPPTRRVPSLEAETLIQMLRIKIWQIIARNNADDLTDPMLNPLQNPTPYVQKVKSKIQSHKSNSNISEITPTLDEILPIPKKVVTEPAPTKESVKSEQTKANPTSAPKSQKKTSAKDLVADEENAELPGQMTIDDAIEESDGAKPKQVKEQENSPNVNDKVDEQAESKKTAEKKEESKKPTLLERYIAWKVDRTEQKDYFNLLEVQIQNKNAACFEILEYLDQLQNED